MLLRDHNQYDHRIVTWISILAYLYVIYGLQHISSFLLCLMGRQRRFVDALMHIIFQGDILKCTIVFIIKM